VTWFRRTSAQTSSASAGDAALVDFVAAHYPRLIRLAGLICRDVVDSEDAVQAGLERAWRSRAALKEPGKLSSWLDRIVVREAIRLGRDRRSLTARVFATTEDIETGLARSGDDLGASVLARASLRHAFEALPAPQRAVIALHLYLGYSIAVTAEIVGAPLETVRSRLRLARDQLRFQLAEAGG
jgi:RNA polymerase sigma-70 factor (ECF subfamily)